LNPFALRMFVQGVGLKALEIHIGIIRKDKNLAENIK